MKVSPVTDAKGTRTSLAGVKKDDIRAWMSGTTRTLAARWKTAWRNAQREP